MPISRGDLVEFAAGVLGAVGVPGADARATAGRLVDADLRGRSGHGLVRLAPYVDRILAGGLNPRPRVEVRHETPVSAQVHGDNGLGQVVLQRAVDLSAEKARAQGVGVVGTVASNHGGAAGLYPLALAERGLVGIYCAVANANGMPPWGGTDPILGTNPLAIAVPTGDHPFVLDIASTATSHGAIKVALREGRSLPPGWVADRDGAPVTDPALAGDALLLPMGGHKGAGLTIALGLLAGVLNGAAFGREVVDARTDLWTPTNTGQLLVALRVDLFRPLEEVLADMSAHLSELRRSAAVGDAPLRLPGDRSAVLWRAHLADGFDPSPQLASELQELASRVGGPSWPTAAHHRARLGGAHEEAP